MVKSKEIPNEDLWPTIKSIRQENMRVYGALLYWLACRAGELLPYTHYKTIYKKDNEGKLLRDHRGNAVIFTKTIEYETLGVPVSTIEIKDKYLSFSHIPVFKTKHDDTKTGVVPKKNNPMFYEIQSYIAQRKILQEEANKIGEETGKAPKTIYLFEREEQDQDNLHFYWRFKKKFERFLANKGFTPHCLRVTRATHLGNSSGDAFHVQQATGHKSIAMAAEYVKKRRLIDSMKKYGEI